MNRGVSRRRSRINFEFADRIKMLLPTKDRASTLLAIATGISVMLPPLALLHYVKTFGVNAVYLDEWPTNVVIFQKMINGSLTFGDLFAQYNVHRLFFPRLISLIILYFTHFNTVGESILSWFMLCSTDLIILLSFKRSLGNSNQLTLLLYLPISLLIFDFRQSDGILWGLSISNISRSSEQ